SMSFDSANNAWRWINYHAVPAGASQSANRHLEPRRSQEQVFVLNALQPYMKNYGLLEGTGLPIVDVGVMNPGVTPAVVNISYNGMLHGWSATAVNQPSKAPLFWPGNFKTNNRALTASNPILLCDGTGQDCRFNPGGKPQATASDPDYGYAWFGPATASAFTTFVYNRSMQFVATDTSARFINFGNLPAWPQHAALNVNTNPWSSAYPPGSGFPDGAPYWMTDCVAPGGSKTAPGRVFYPGFFRPDSEFSYTTNECDHGSG
ncbi:MAG TPA: hypothetical protein VM328_12205, partial [Fimbriimonadaceae bacterium]|nr:hypothetical protein [Fimbriimonadaceae bacterium]